MNMPASLRSVVFLLLLPLAAALSVPELAGQTNSDPNTEMDRIFEAFDSARSPGCAVAVEDGGERVVERAYGMADLEFQVANSPSTIFEAGSVAKQFTSAAIVLLSLDGALSLEDDVRTYVPEVPEYGETITIRHLMTHTSGLRDWGSVAAISGWGRSNRTHTHDHVLDIVSRQSALNYPPGEAYSYTNTGYNLLAVIVERVSGMSFADFSRERIFEPLGLHDTQWRDDYTRIVPRRSSAYSPRGDGFRINRPIEDVHGNGGLLTTVGDLLRWNRHLHERTLGEEFVAEMHTRAVLTDGSQIHYAGGLQFGTQNGVPRISHTGSTSGYRAYLALFPDRELSLALLCNVSTANPGGLGAQVAAVFLPEPPVQEEEEEAPAPIEEAEEPASFQPSSAELQRYTGVYHSADAETTLRVEVEQGTLVMYRRPSSRIQLSPGDETHAFSGSLGGIHFIEDSDGTFQEFSLRQGRVHDLRFHRVEE
jgi:CubicO group peptidase (beta-lactamase class C family)